MNVGVLRQMLDGVPDDTPVFVYNRKQRVPDSVTVATGVWFEPEGLVIVCPLVQTSPRVRRPT
jgi:hypothetical protein